MANSINVVVLTGRFTADPELKQTSTGKNVTSFALAVQRAYSQKNEADFIDCVAWNKNAEFISRFFHKGDIIAITGQLQTRLYDDKNGNKRKLTEVLIDSWAFCGGKSENSETTQKSTPKTTVKEDIDFEEIGSEVDDFPFN